MGNRATSQKLIDLGNRIRERRQEVHMSQEELAEKAGINSKTVSRIEGGQTAMSVEILQKLTEALSVDANLLLGIVALPLEDDRQIREMFHRLRYLKQGEQDIVVQTMGALMDGLKNSR